jgi:hypothetical protein
MSFLAPLFLLGALAIALPVVFHLIRRTTRERTRFSSLMFLHSTPPRLTRRNRLEHLLLLVLRCLALVLLAAGFARPFFRHQSPQPPAGGPAKKLLVLLDTSASMRRQGLWPQAVAQVEAVLRDTAPADEVALFAFDRQSRPLVSFEQWRSTPPADRLALAKQRLAGAAPGWSGTGLDQALIQAAETLADSADEPAVRTRQITVISDLQAGSRLGALQGYSWPRGVEVALRPVAPPRPASNAGLHVLSEAPHAEPLAEARLRLRVANEPDSRREQFQLGWARADGSFLGAARDVYVPPGQSRVADLPWPAPEAGARARVRGDDEDFDNTAFALPPRKVNINILYWGGEAAADARRPLYFLTRAFRNTRRQAVRVLAPDPAAPPSPADLDAAALFIVTDALPREQARRLREQVARGKTLLAAPSSVGAAPILQDLLQAGALSLAEGTPANYCLLSDIDFRHPLFAPFADARFSDFTKIHFWKYRRLDPASLPGARVLARFDNGDPALLEVPVGRGRVLVLTSGWHPADSQLALSSKFVPLLYAMLELNGGPPPLDQFLVDDTIPFPADLPPGTSNVTLFLPDGSRQTWTNGVSFTGAAPGIYRVEAGTISKEFAVNLDPAESRTAALPLDELERLGAPMSRSQPAPDAMVKPTSRQQDADLEGSQKLWRWFLVTTLAVLIIETWLAGRAARRLAVQGGAAL